MDLVFSTRAVTLLGADAFGAFAKTRLFAFRFPMRFWSSVLNSGISGFTRPRSPEDSSKELSNSFRGDFQTCFDRAP